MTLRAALLATALVALPTLAFAADPDLKVIKAYDSALIRVGNIGISDRISYVIAPDGKIVYAFSDRSPDKHVENTMAAVRQLQKK